VLALGTRFREGTGREVLAQKALRATGCILPEGKVCKKLHFCGVCSNREMKMLSEGETTH